MAPLEMIWPNEMHTAPTATAYAAKLLCGHPILTSDAAMIWWASGPYKTLDDLSDRAAALGLRVTVLMTPNV